MATMNDGVLGGNLRGKAGSTVFSQTKNGTVVRPRTDPKNPRTPLQQAARLRMTRANAAWKTVSSDAMTGWATYCAMLARVRIQEGNKKPVAPHLVFRGLACKYLQVHPHDAVPLDAPGSVFAGDTIGFQLFDDTGAILLISTSGNADGVVTEVLLQRLAHVNRTPLLRAYRTQAFNHFALSGQVLRLHVRAGVYAVAYRMVNDSTGEAGGLFELGVVTVQG